MRATTMISACLLLAPVPAQAQTLTVEIEGAIEAPPGTPPPRDRRPGDGARRRDARANGAASAVVVVRPPERGEAWLEGDAPRRLDGAEARRRGVGDAAGAAAGDARARVSRLVTELEAAERAARSAEEGAGEDADEGAVEGWAGFEIWAEALDLRGLDLEVREPEIAALDGLRLAPGWAGNAPLRQHVVGGAGLQVGIRVARIIRGPELRLSLGGGDAAGPWTAAPGGPAGVELALRSSFVFRAEAAMGLQVELGPVVPYVLGRAAAGVVVADVAVRDTRLGALGTEAVEAPLLQLGLEAGLGLRLVEGLALGAAFRASFLGAPGYGGVLTLTAGG